MIFLIGNYQGSALKTTVSRSCDASLPKLNVPHESVAKNAHFPLKRTSVACNNNHFFVFKMFPEFILEKSSNCRFVVSSRATMTTVDFFRTDFFSRGEKNVFLVKRSGNN